MSTDRTPPDDAVEARLRSALQARADSVPIRGDGLQLIHAVVHRPRIPRWRPILAVAAALVVIAGVGFGVRAIDDDSVAGGGSSAAGAKAESAQDAAAGEDGSSTYVGTPLPVSAGTPLVWPYPDTKTAYRALTGAVSSAQVIYRTPQEAAVDFVRATAPSVSAAKSVPDDLSASATNGTVVAVQDSAGRVVSNVLLRVVVGGGRFTYVVVGATAPGGDAAELTIDPPSLIGGSVSVRGNFSGSLRASAAGLTVVPVLSSGVGAAQSSASAALTDASDTWSDIVTGKPHGVVVCAVDTAGTCLALVATTVPA